MLQKITIFGNCENIWIVVPFSKIWSAQIFFWSKTIYIAESTCKTVQDSILNEVIWLEFEGEMLVANT
jgi:hypothetical protein